MAGEPPKAKGSYVKWKSLGSERGMWPADKFNSIVPPHAIFGSGDFQHECRRLVLHKQAPQDFWLGGGGGFQSSWGRTEYETRTAKADQLQITVLREVTPCILEDRHQCFGGPSCFSYQGKMWYHNPANQNRTSYWTSLSSLPQQFYD
jgi:hypothetical protein